MISEIEKLTDGDINITVNMMLHSNDIDYCGEDDESNILFDYVEFTGLNMWGGDRNHLNIELKTGVSYVIETRNVNRAMCIAFIMENIKNE